MTGDERCRTAATFFWDVVTKERSYVTGGNSDDEHFSPKQELSKHIGPNTTETCNTYNMLKLTRQLFGWDPRPEYADYYERALLNHILASQNPENGMVCYYLPLKTGCAKHFGTPEDSFWCCSGTGVENHAKYGDSIYFHEGEHSLFVNLFIASELSWPEKGLRLRQETNFPVSDSTRLLFTCDKPVQLSLNLRHPYWATSGIEVAVNGRKVTECGTTLRLVNGDVERRTTLRPGSYVTIDRRWSSGDTIELRMPMSLRTEAFRDNPRKLAILYGPLVLCAEVQPGKQYPAIVAGLGDCPDFRGDNVVPNQELRHRENGTVPLSRNDILSAIRPVAGKPLCFTGSPAVFRSEDGARAGSVHAPLQGVQEGVHCLLGRHGRSAVGRAGANAARR